MLRLSASTTDDRGRKVPVFDLAHGDNAKAVAEDPRLAALSEHLTANAQPRPTERLTRSHLVPLLLPCAVLLTLGVGLYLIAPNFAKRINFLIIPVTVVIVSPIAARMLLARQSGTIIANLLSYGRCPSCAYFIHSLADQPNGCVECPECGSAWLRSRMPTQVAEPVPIRTPPHLKPVHSWRRRSPITDARGVVRTPIDPRLLDLTPARRAAIGEQRLTETKDAVRDATSHQRSRLVTYAVIFAVMALANIVTMFTVVSSVENRVLGLVVIAFVVALCGGFIWQVLTYRATSVAIPAAESLTAHHICPFCAGELASEPTPSNLLVCSGCDATLKSGKFEPRRL